MLSTVILWAVGLMEFLICCYFFAYVALYVIPWAELREKREISRGIARRLPALRARVQRVAKQAAAAPLVRNPSHLRELNWRMTDDVVGLAKHCAKLADTIAREHGMWPREMLQIEDILGRTLDVIEATCAMRNADLPVLAQAYVQMALERIAHVESMREVLSARVAELSAEGACYDHEARCLSMLGTALQAHRLLAETDPARVIELSAKWVNRLRLIAESAELRGVTQRRLREVRSEFPERAERVRILLQSVRAHLPLLRKTAVHKSVAFRMVTLEAADDGIVKVEEELARAEAVCRTAGTDLGTSGQSGRGLAEALRSAERAHVTLTGYEDDLAFIAAAFAAAKSDSSDNVN